MLSERLKELRELRIKGLLALEKVMKMAGEQWLRSKHAFAICNMKTGLYRLGSCIDDALLWNDKLGLIASACVGSLNLYAPSQTLDLSVQESYVWLRSIDASVESTPNCYIKQRSERWFSERKKAKLTGSTL